MNQEAYMWIIAICVCCIMIMITAIIKIRYIEIVQYLGLLGGGVSIVKLYIVSNTPY
jgi:hypothetical protein